MTPATHICNELHLKKIISFRQKFQSFIILLSVNKHLLILSALILTPVLSYLQTFPILGNFSQFYPIWRPHLCLPVPAVLLTRSCLFSRSGSSGRKVVCPMVLFWELACTNLVLFSCAVSHMIGKEGEVTVWTFSCSKPLSYLSSSSWTLALNWNTFCEKVFYIHSYSFQFHLSFILAKFITPIYRLLPLFAGA